MKKVATFFIIAVMSLVKAYAADTASLTVNIADESGNPLAGAFVSSFNPYFEAESDEAGVAKVTGINAEAVSGKVVELFIFREGYAETTAHADFTETLNPVLNVTLSEQMLSVIISVVDEEYEPIEGAWVSFLNNDYTSNEAGQVVVDGLAALQYLGTSEVFGVYKDGYEYYEGTVEFDSYEPAAVAMLKAAEATFTLKVFGGEDEEAAPVADAWVLFMDQEYTTNANGEVKATVSAPLVIGQEIPFAVYKDGYEYYEGVADFTESMEAYPIVNLVAAEATFTLKVFGGDDDEAAPVADAWVMFMNQEYTTNENGEVKATVSAPLVIGQEIPFAVYKDGYEYYEGVADFTESMEAYPIVFLVAAEATVSVKVVTGEENDPVAEATVTFEGKEYTTNENGEVKISGLNGPDVIGKVLPITIAKVGFITYTGEADFTETLDAFVTVELVEEQSAIKEINAAASSSKVFDLQGRQVSKAAKGQIYIVNGRKVRL